MALSSVPIQKTSPTLLRIETVRKDSIHNTWRTCRSRWWRNCWYLLLIASWFVTPLAWYHPQKPSESRTDEAPKIYEHLRPMEQNCRQLTYSTRAARSFDPHVIYDLGAVEWYKIHKNFPSRLASFWDSNLRKLGRSWNGWNPYWSWH